MRMLVYCGTRDGINVYKGMGWNTLYSSSEFAEGHEILSRFREDPEGKLAVGLAMSFGWRFPKDTRVLFDQSWPYDRNSSFSLQAVGRVDWAAR